MPAEPIDPLGEKRHLNFGGTGVGRTAAELREDAALFLAGKSHCQIILSA
jgi:hypothetical protein